MTCRHTDMGGDVTYIARVEWLMRRGYRPRRCPGCGRLRSWAAPNGREVASFTDEYRRRQRAFAR